MQRTDGNSNGISRLAPNHPIRIQEKAEEEIDPSTNLPLEATKKGKHIIKQRKNIVKKLEKKIDQHLGTDIEGPWMDQIHSMKRKVKGGCCCLLLLLLLL